MSRIHVDRSEQLLAAARDGKLHYDTTRGWLWHATSWGFQPSTKRDTRIVADLFAAGRLRQCQHGAITTAGAP